jgi:hypothetical protein
MTALDAQLAAVRRVDWRFLLPRPELGRVGCAGAVPASLRQGLEASGATVVPLDRQASVGALPEPCDHVVAVLSDVRQAAAVDSPKPNGWLIVEVEGLRAGRWLRRPLTPAAWVRALERQGWREVRAFAHWPDFETCAQVVPVGEPAAWRLALRRGGSGRSTRLFAAAARLGLAVGILPGVVPCFSVVARRPGTDGSPPAGTDVARRPGTDVARRPGTGA